MTPTVFLYSAAGFLLFFAFGHTIGHFTRHKLSEIAAQKVLKSMQETRFNQFGKMRSFDENYRGMSFNLLVTLLSFAGILMILANQWQKNPDMTSWLLLPVSIATAVFTITGWRFFFPLPAITCLFATCSLLIAQWQLFNY